MQLCASTIKCNKGAYVSPMKQILKQAQKLHTWQDSCMNCLFWLAHMTGQELDTDTDVITKYAQPKNVPNMWHLHQTFWCFLNTSQQL